MDTKLGRRRWMAGAAAGLALGCTRTDPVGRVGAGPGAEREARATGATGPRIEVRRAADRGRADHGWLDTRHTFSFADYRDPAHMGFASLRVINEDRVTAGQGFPMHPHRDMEILTYVLDGALQHRDTMGNGSVIVPGDVQHMSAGVGVRHSEYNPQADEGVHFLQIWIHPRAPGGSPFYGQRTWSVDAKSDRLALVASPDGADGSLPIATDARLYASLLEPGRSLTHTAAPGRRTWIQVARGAVRANGVGLAAGDGGFTTGSGAIRLEAAEDSELLVFDLA